ncbi:hypothetical protein O3M35_002768 [Rhynocoris fuscipes]|uniref:Uncharacterized protein n=1 Tax=Rhynocoris fuscipes TaxID=488301 RepID=A0AAW1CLH6_9HEMI
MSPPALAFRERLRKERSAATNILQAKFPHGTGTPKFIIIKKQCQVNGAIFFLRLIEAIMQLGKTCACATGKRVMPEGTARNWFTKYKNGKNFDLEDAALFGRPNEFDEERLLWKSARHLSPII